MKMEDLSKETVTYLFHHLFLPSKLPSGDDASGRQDLALISFVLESMDRFLEKAGTKHEEAVRAASGIMRSMQLSKNEHGLLQEEGVAKVLQQIASSGLTAAFHVAAQNAGVIASPVDDFVVFDFFELSPTNSAVFSTQGRLIRRFPATAVRVPLGTFSQPGFQRVFTGILVKMSGQTVEGTKEKVAKAGQQHDEERDTTNPRIVTELLMSFLRGVGQAADVEGLVKNTREEVMWNNSKLPWRRSPLWLLVRVSLQLTMARLGGESANTYKCFMVFLLARVLEAAQHQESSSQMLDTIMAKICRRLKKLGHEQSGDWLVIVDHAVSRASELVMRRWKGIQEECEPQLDLPALSTLDMESDGVMRLAEMEDFISSISARKKRAASGFCPTAGVVPLSADELPVVEAQISGSSSYYKRFQLAIIESWVANHLDNWIEAHIQDEESCKQLCNLMRLYHDKASPRYAGQPEDTSRMLLVILELWIAADRAAIHAIPLLREYDPEIPVDLFQALLLAFKRDMTRLHRAESYVSQRQAFARKMQRPSIFHSYGHPDSFQVRFFAASTMHQNLMLEIENDAAKARLDKKKEFESLQNQYSELMAQYTQHNCDQVSRKRHGVEYWDHPHYCYRCNLRRRAEKLSIKAHEWPLPENRSQAQATVFELIVPPSFGEWRDTTMLLLEDVLSQVQTFPPVQYTSKKKKKQAKLYTLREYTALSRYASSCRWRLHLLSETKPHVVTHRQGKYVGSSVFSDICVNNGLRLQYYDDGRQAFVRTIAPTLTLALSEQCTFRLPGRSKMLQSFLQRTCLQPDGQTPNNAIASQSTCPNHMILGEFKALATLPYGHRIQWMNVLAQLAMPEIDFNKPETAMFLLQISLQAGPRSSDGMARCSHARLQDTDFGLAMFENLDQSVLRIQENWESFTALSVFTLLATRLVSMADAAIKDKFLNLLCNCRNISYKWLFKLRQRVHEITDDQQLMEFQRIILGICLTCVSSFSVDDEFLQQILSDPEQSAILVEVSVNIYNNANLLDSNVDPLQTVLHDKWVQTLHRARPIFSQSLGSKVRDASLNLAIKKCWPDFSSNGEWSLVASTCHWFETTSSQLRVHVDVLTGQLLVDGQPLSRLPREYESHASYKRLFGRSVWEVMPSSHPGLKFCSTKTFHGHTAHFGLQEAPGRGNLLVRLDDHGKDGSSLELVPPAVFSKLLPNCFVENFVHWYHCSDNVIEFRPLDDQWTHRSDKNWFLSRHGSHWKLVRGGGQILIGPKSNTANRVADILSPLEAPLDLYMVFNSSTRVLSIELPRLRLVFQLKQGDSWIRSKQFQNMFIDADQSIGTLVGLSSKLVLRDIRDARNRRVIIPHGEVCFVARNSAHVNVFVRHGSANRVNAYAIDTLLCRLTDDGKLESKLHLCYVHALTAYSRPDPFTSRTGTEQALNMLASASLRSAGLLSQVAFKTLTSIAAVTPGRTFYPPREKVMQKVDWDSTLSFFVQDARFLKQVKEILARNSELEFLHLSDFIKSVERVTPAHANMYLNEREIIRNATCCVSGFGAEDFTNECDEVYQARDCGRQSVVAQRVSKVVYHIDNNLQAVPCDVSSNLVSHLYDLLDGNTTGKVHLDSDLEYDPRWLQHPRTFLPGLLCPLHFTLQDNNQFLDKFQAMFWLGTLTYANSYDEQVTQLLILLYLFPSAFAIDLPDNSNFRLSQGDTPDRKEIRDAIDKSVKSFDECPEWNLELLSNEETLELISRRQMEHDRNMKRAKDSIKDGILQQWPCTTPCQPLDQFASSYINIHTATRLIVPKWKTWHDNFLFRKYLESLAQNLRKFSVKSILLEPASEPSSFLRPRHTQGFVSVKDAFSHAPENLISESEWEPSRYIQTEVSCGMLSHKLTQVVDLMESKTSFAYERRYLLELRESLSYLSATDTLRKSIQGCPKELKSSLQRHLERCEGRVQSLYNSLCQAFSSYSEQSFQGCTGISTTINSILRKAEWYPRICPISFLQQLRSCAWNTLSEAWKDAIVTYGVAITLLQQARRLVRIQDDEVAMLRELENTGRQNWNAHDFPEWLLLECESELMVRKEQIQVARKMMMPPDNKNSVMQLNMGEGKSSVIIPLITLALSDGSQLVRVIVAKPQAKQMHQILISKIAGLMDRPVYQMPFSRAIKMDSEKAAKIRQVAARCMQEGGVVMVQPEHLLSFQLMGIEREINGNCMLADKLADTQGFFNDSARDVVDESDENFSVKFELVYTIGQQQPIDYSPDRWIIVQRVLGLVAELSEQLKCDFPQSVDLDRRHAGRFPRVRILDMDAQEALVSQIAASICARGMQGFPLAHQSEDAKQNLSVYLTRQVLSSNEIEAVEKGPFWNETTIKSILLLRGLLAGGILAFALGQKRWRVNYGVDGKRDKIRLAVPFRAKDSPTPRSEFSHPEVVIVLTCLSYYYSGLSNNDLFNIFEQLVRCDEAEHEYRVWIESCVGIPESYRQLQGVNLGDRIQCEMDIFPHLRYSKGAIDYFLSKMVFAKESREFPHKLSASGWDLGRTKSKPVTGFSGTNDSRHVLPLDVKQLEVPEQKHTNALVLEYLLQPENKVALAPHTAGTLSFDSKTLLDMMASMPNNTRVVLDVGAQIIDVGNLEFSRQWLQLQRYEDDEHTQAVVFFDDGDELMVLDKAGNIEQLQTSPFATQMDHCLVLIDEVHTRGTDLKLPADYQAAVTLGANLTKDRLVQACMRMRRLGKGQSVVFCIPWEIEHSILRHQGRIPPLTSTISVTDVLCWAIAGTCLDLRRTIPLWLTQGCRFHKQQPIWASRPSSDDADAQGRAKWAQLFLEPEAQSLEHQYKPGKATTALGDLVGPLESQMADLFRQRCADFGLHELRGAAMLHEEQERELSPEAEREQQVELPPRFEPLVHTLHADVEHFVASGRFPKCPSGLRPAFEALHNTSAALHVDVTEFPGMLWVTKDFSSTVKVAIASRSFSDAFQRCVQWIMTSSDDTRVLIISPFEAEALIPRIEESKSVMLHLYSPRINLELPSLDGLDLYTIPAERPMTRIISRQAITQLNLFAGQLYLSSFDDYACVCEALGLAWTSDPRVVPESDGFIPPGLVDSTGALANTSGLSRSPVLFFKVLMTKVRRNCQGIPRTHMGKILDGVRLEKRDFEDDE